MYVLLLITHTTPHIHTHTLTHTLTPHHTHTHSVSELSQVYTKQDWILDVEWIMYNSLENFKVAIALAHNCVTIFDSQSNTELIYPSEVNCLLYPLIYIEIYARFHIEEWKGGISLPLNFRQILFQHATTSQLQAFCGPRICLKQSQRA